MKFGGHYKQLIFVLLIVVPALVGCKQRSSQNSSASETPVHSQRYTLTELTNMLPAGLDSKAIISTIGPPSQEMSWSNSPSTTLDYTFGPATREGEPPGITVFLVSNRLVKWRPYVVAAPTLREWPLMFPQSLAARLGFSIVSETPFDGAQFIDNSEMPRLGYVPKRSPVRIATVDRLAGDGNPIERVTFDVSAADPMELYEFTKTNINKKVLFTIDDKPATTFVIRSPIAGGRVSFGMSAAIVLRLLPEVRGIP